MRQHDSLDTVRYNTLLTLVLWTKLSKAKKTFLRLLHGFIHNHTSLQKIKPIIWVIVFHGNLFNMQFPKSNVHFFYVKLKDNSTVGKEGMFSHSINSHLHISAFFIHWPSNKGQKCLQQVIHPWDVNCPIAVSRRNIGMPQASRNRT